VLNTSRKRSLAHDPGVDYQLLSVSATRENSDFSQRTVPVSIEDKQQKAFRIEKIVAPRRFRVSFPVWIELVGLIHKFQFRFAEWSCEGR
jgi:hypothetical protein